MTEHSVHHNDLDETRAVGAGLKHEHEADIFAGERRVDFFEIHAENYMGAGGPPHHLLRQLRESYPLSLHGVGLSIGGAGPLDREHIRRLSGLVLAYCPALFSEHLAWSSHDGVFLNDLLPLPYNEATLAHVCAHIDQVQDALRMRMLLENPSTYVSFAASTMSEIEFLRAIVARTGCGLLLDVNNVFVSATNHGYAALDYLSDFPLAEVGEIHLAGHAEQSDDEGERLLIDSHDGPVADAVWKLYEIVISRCDCIPTLIEWDSKIPAWPILRAEAAAAQAILDRFTSALAVGGHRAA